MDQPLALEILQRTNTGLMVVNQQHEILFCNHWLQSRCRWNKPTDGVTIETLFTRFEEPRIARALTDALQFGITSILSHSIHKNIFPLIKKSGDAIHHTVLIQAIQHNEALYALIEVTDVTSPIKRERSLRKAQQTADRANQAKEEFLASMSHELRTPLTTIIGNSQLLADEERHPLKQKWIHAIEVAGRNQLALVNDILDMSKIDSGKFTIEQAPFNLNALLHELEELFANRAKEQGIQLLFHPQWEERHLLLGDRQRINQILINLISNAIKFTEQGSVEISIEQTGEQLHFTVIDTGVGMPEETLERLFQPFEQADSSISRRFGGTGLGLYISQHLAQLMEGSIEVSSLEGEGSCFTLRLPYRATELPVQPISQSQTDALFQQRLEGSVLLAEDCSEIQQLMRHILESIGIEVTTANNGKEAVALATNNHFDLILMDMQMPVMNGIDATRAIRQHAIDTPLVALTANVLQKHRDAFEAVGCNRFLTKPIDIQELQQVLQQHLEAVEAPPVSQTRLSHEQINQLFIASCRERTNTLLDAASERDWIEVRHIAHTIKGSATTFGHPTLSELGKQLCELIDQQKYQEIEHHIILMVQKLNAIR